MTLSGNMRSLLSLSLECWWQPGHFYIIYKNRQEKSRLLKRAQRDALTGLFNKKTTQDMIDRFLEEKEKTDAMLL